MRVFDKESLMERVGGREAFYQKMLAMFFELAPKQIEELRELASHKDFLSIKAHVHKMKGSFATISAMRLRQLAEKMENAAESMDYPAFQREFKKLDLEYEAFLNAASFSEENDWDQK